MTLFGFLYNTLSKRANNPANKKFRLPKALAGVNDPRGDGKLLPLREKDWHLGLIKGEAAKLITKI